MLWSNTCVGSHTVSDQIVKMVSTEFCAQHYTILYTLVYPVDFIYNLGLADSPVKKITELYS